MSGHNKGEYVFYFYTDGGQDIKSVDDFKIRTLYTQYSNNMFRAQGRVHDSNVKSFNFRLEKNTGYASTTLGSNTPVKCLYAQGHNDHRCLVQEYIFTGCNL